MKMPLIFEHLQTSPSINENWFSEWFNSPYYDLLYQHRNDEEAALFIDNLLNHLELNPDAVIADMPCGNGRHARQLAAKGYSVYAYDLSEKNIREAAKHQTANLHTAVHDMRQYVACNVFDVLFNLFTSLGYFRGDYVDRRILKNFYAAIKPGGKLVLDYFNAPVVLRNLQKESRVTHDGVEFHIQRYYDGKRIIKTMEITDRQSVHHFAERVRAYTMTELCDLLQQAGFQITEVFGDYQLHSFEEQLAPRCILIAQKKPL
jgi:SAM-dependent methyltransferase